MDRELLKKTAQETNNIGSRLYFVRDKLKMSLAYVSRETNIPTSTLHDRELNIRTCIYEDLLLLSYYYDKIWQARYFKFNSYPCYKGKEIKEISIMWLLFGFDQNREDFEFLLENIKQNYQLMIDEKNELIKQMEAQLNLEDFIANKIS